MHLRRQKNRQAARKCRSKKIRCTNETEQILNDLRSTNHALKTELSNWRARFMQVEQMRELLKVRSRNSKLVGRHFDLQWAFNEARLGNEVVS